MVQLAANWTNSRATIELESWPVLLVAGFILLAANSTGARPNYRQLEPLETQVACCGCSCCCCCCCCSMSAAASSKLDPKAKGPKPQARKRNIAHDPIDWSAIGVFAHKKSRLAGHFEASVRLFIILTLVNPLDC